MPTWLPLLTLFLHTHQLLWKEAVSVSTGVSKCCLLTTVPFCSQAEYAEARKDLERQVQSGKSLEEISQALKGGSASGGDGDQNGAPAVHVPEDLVGVQAYLRWERNGKKDYPPEEQQVRSPFAGGPPRWFSRASLQRSVRMMPSLRRSSGCTDRQDLAPVECCSSTAAVGEGRAEGLWL